jgi:hypothetical protein
MVIGAIVFAQGSAVSAQTKDERIEPSAKEMVKIQALTPDHFAKSATTEDDDLEPVVTITTLKGYRSNGRFTDPVRSDNFLRAFISKRTGEVRYQLYQTVSYNFKWRYFTSVNFATPSGPQSAKLDVIEREVVSCMGGICSYRETIGFDLSEDRLKEIAATYLPQNAPLWRFRFKADNGIDWEDRMSPAEAAGLLAAVRDYRSRHPGVEKQTD